MIRRRRRNKIDGLFNDVGVWCEDPVDLKSIAASHFRNLFSAQVENDTRFHIPILFPSITHADISSLESHILPEEIKASLFHIGGLKSSWCKWVPCEIFSAALESYWEGYY